MHDLDKLARETLILSRNTLLVNLRFLDMALSQFQMAPYPLAIATDGANLYYSPIYVLQRFQEAKEEITRDYLHIVFHCVFRHMFMGSLVNERLWNLACDIAVECAIGELGLKAVVTKKEIQQQGIVNILSKDVSPLTAEKIYRYLLDEKMSERKLKEWEEAFVRDDHSVWYLNSEDDSSNDQDEGEDGNGENNSQPQADSSNQDDEEDQDQDKESSDDKQKQGDSSNQAKETSLKEDASQQKQSGESSKSDSQKDGQDEQGQNHSSKTRKELEQEWKDISERMQQEMETFAKQQGDTAGNMMQNLREVNQEKYDYTAFLRKFAVNTEVMKINDDEFDYIFYTYGLNLYKRMPLIEPLEYKDAKRIREFVIAIDTSGSVQGELVQKFVQKTYNILKSTETFASKINVHILQCDAQVQEHIKITKQEEFENYLKNMTLKGFGGTDFRPVFNTIDQMIANEEFLRLKGLIYFTDGYGEFPQRKPSYETAFVFVDEGFNNYDVPSWAIKLVLREEDF